MQTITDILLGLLVILAILVASGVIMYVHLTLLNWSNDRMFVSLFGGVAVAALLMIILISRLT